MIKEDPGMLPWLWTLLTSVVVGGFSFVLGTTSFKAKAAAKDESIEKEIALMQNDINRLENEKVDKDRLNIVVDDIKRLDTNKVDKEIIALMQDQYKDLNTKLSEILNRLPPANQST